MIWLLKPDQPPTAFAPAMDEGMGILPDLPSVKGKPVPPGSGLPGLPAVTDFAQLGKDLTEVLEKVPARHSPYPAQAVLPVVLADIAGSQRPICRSRKVGPGPVSSPMS
jgi:hypothetical protein